jgi:hypothetical protein
MKVHTLDIDSGERDTTIYEYSNNYSVTLKTPLYNVTKLEVISARIPRNRIINHFNNKFTIHDDNGSYDVELDPLDNSIAGTPSETAVATFVKNAIATAGCDTVDQVAYSYSKFQFSNVAATNEFNLDFYNGVDGWSSNVMNRTTPNQIFGLNASNISSSSSVIKGGVPGVAIGPKTFVLKISAGSDNLNQDSYTNTPFYTGVFMNNDDSTQKYYTFYGSDDSFVHEFNNGPQREISSLKIQWYYKENNKLVPIDFMERDHAIKLRIHGSTDKLEGLPKVPLKIVEDKPKINIPDVLEDVYKWKMEYISIGLIIFVGIILLFLMHKRPKLNE